MNQFMGLSTYELNKAKTERVQRIRGIEDEIDMIEVVMQGRLDTEAAEREVERIIATLSPAAREQVVSTLISGVPATVVAEATPGEE